jgi:hypothetical protein
MEGEAQAHVAGPSPLAANYRAVVASIRSMGGEEDGFGVIGAPLVDASHRVVCCGPLSARRADLWTVLVSTGSPLVAGPGR